MKRFLPGIVTLALLLAALAVRSGIVFGMVVLVTIFVPMEKLFALHPRKARRDRWRTDVVQYWAHRATHQVPFLWRFHKVHHSIEEMDWLAAGRLHPLDSVFTRAI